MPPRRHQIKHVRISKYGKAFTAGVLTSRVARKYVSVVERKAGLRKGAMRIVGGVRSRGFSFKDVDVLVHKKHVPAILSAFRSLRFKKTIPVVQDYTKQFAMSRKVTLFGERSNVTMDVFVLKRKHL